MDKAYDFVISVSFFLEIEIVTTKTVNSKGLKKICRQLLSTTNVLNIKVFFLKKVIIRWLMETSIVVSTFATWLPIESAVSSFKRGQRL